MGHRADGDRRRPGGDSLDDDAHGTRHAAVAAWLTRRRDSWPWVALSVLFLTLTALVATGVADPLDTRVARHFRPMNDWGVLQDRYAPWLTRLAPVRMFALLAVTCVAVAAWRRSWTTVLLGIAPAVLGVGTTLLVKAALARPDPLGGASPDGGSYPSGHMLAVVVTGAVCVLLVSPRVRWWGWAVLLVPSGLMATALVVTASHWVSDVAGAALLAGAVVTGTRRLILPRRPRKADRLPEGRRAVPEWDHRLPGEETG